MSRPWYIHRGQIMAGTVLGTFAAGVAMAPGWITKAALCSPLVVIGLLWWLLADISHWLIAFFLTAWLLPPLPVALGNSGPHLCMVLAAAGVWMGALGLRGWRIHLDGTALPILILLGSFCLSLPMAILYSGPEIAALSAARLCLFAISVYCYFFIRGMGPANFRKVVPILFWTGAASALFACVDFYFQFPAPAGYGPQFIWLASGVFRRAQGLFYEASTLGNLCAFFLVFVAVCLFSGRYRASVDLEHPLPPRWGLVVGGGVFAGALVLSYSRASLLNLLAAAVALAVLERKRIRFGRVIPAAMILAGAAVLTLLILVPEFAQAYWIRAAASVQYFLESPNGVLSGRVGTWRILLDFLYSHPLFAIFGVGYKTLPYSDFIGAPAIADNAYLSALVETGAGGLSALVLLNAAVLRSAYRASQSNLAWRSVLGSWIFCFWCGQVVQMFSGDLLTYWRVLPAYLCILALAEGDRRAD